MKTAQETLLSHSIDATGKVTTCTKVDVVVLSAACASPQNTPLKAYSKEASFLAPSHCRLCFHAFPNRPALSAHTATAAAADKQEVLAHLQTHGLLSMEDRHDDDED